MQIDPNQPLIQTSADRLSNSSRQRERTGEQPTDLIEVKTEHQALINQASGDDPNHSAKVLEARNEIESGQLDTPQAARKTAESILNFGI